MKLITAPSKTWQVTDIIRRRIENGTLRPGDRLEPIRMLADKFSVSRQVILSAFDKLASEGLLIKTVGRGTFINPAINETSRDSIKIGYFVHDSKISSHYNRSVFLGILEKADEYNAEVIWGTNHNDRDAAEWIKAKNIDGLLLTGRVTDRLIKKLKTTRVPFIVLGNYRLSEPVNLIEADETSCLSNLFAAMSDRFGIKSAGAILGPKDLYVSTQYANKVRLAIEAVGGTSSADWIIFSDQEKGYAEFKLMMSLERQPDVVFITGNAFPGAAKYIFEHNLSDKQRPLIITSARERSAILYPELISAVIYSIGSEFGHRGVEMLTGMLQHKDSGSPVALKVKANFEVLNC